VKSKVGMITIGQAPRVDIVPEMADLLGPSLEVVERGALDGLAAGEIAALAPGPDDEVLVTRLTDGGSAFVAKRHVTPRVQAKIGELEAAGVAMTVLLCTGHFPDLVATKPLIEPDQVLLGVLRGVKVRGRLGVLTPSDRHLEPARARWLGYGFDPVVVAASPYHGAAPLTEAIAAFKADQAGLVLLDCIGFRRPAREALTKALGVPVVVANLLVARVVAELGGA
jgi:protein AroM